jgi:Protein of unknown function (DUF3750)
MMRAAAALAACVASGCIWNARPPVSHDAAPDEAIISLESTTMPEPIHGVARHAFFRFRPAHSSQWWKVEFGYIERNNVRVHAVWHGPEAERGIACLKKNEADVEADIMPHYLPWPGPNSNTFIDRLLRMCGLHADLPATAIGRDYRGVIGLSFTSGGTGFQIETPLFGLRLGLTEGIEVHLLALAFGIDLWPPAIVLPIDPGRLGFDDR